MLSWAWKVQFVAYLIYPNLRGLTLQVLSSGSNPDLLLEKYYLSLEGMLITCAYDYLSEDWSHRSFILYAFTVNFCIPMTTILYFYTQIVKAVVTHEASLRAQAKKMNVESLRSNVVRYLTYFYIKFINSIAYIYL